MKFVLSNLSLVLLASTTNFIVDAHNVRVGHVTQEEKHGDDLDALEGRAYQDLVEAKANLERSELEFEQAEARLNDLEGKIEGRWQWVSTISIQVFSSMYLPQPFRTNATLTIR